jgi:hypothetical protein
VDALLWRKPGCGATAEKRVELTVPTEKDSGMDLDEAQRKKVAEWVAQGLKLSEIQNRLQSELGVRMTYMEVRFLVDDLKLTPKDVDIPKTPASALAAPGPAASAKPAQTNAPPPPSRAGAPAGGVSVAVDQIARPGTVVSGRVTFSDGQKAEWYVDQNGQLGLAPQQKGYRPPARDVQQFQVALDAELSKMGF